MMSLRRLGRLASVAVFVSLWLACGDYYRPVVIPLTTTPPSPSNDHSVFALTTNVQGNPGTGMEIDVSGDSTVGETDVFLPMNAALAPNHSFLFVANAGSLVAGNSDSLDFLSPGSILGGNLSLAHSVSLPTGSVPDFVATAENGFVYVANFGSSTVTPNVTAINTSTNQVTNSATVGTGPVAMVETPTSTAAPQKLYVANQASNSITSLNSEDLTQNVVTGFTGNAPVWLVARGDGQKVYVLTQGDGQLVTIDTATDTVFSSLPVGAGANFIFYDPTLGRLYVTNPVTDTVYVFSDTGGPNDTPDPTPLAVISFASGSSVCPSGCSPSSVTALLDGTRFYVASYQAPASCPDANVSGPCVIPQLTVFNAPSFTVKIPSVPLLSNPPFVTNQVAVPPVGSCATPTPYTPGVTRFRVFTTAAEDSSHVYVSMCDAGAIADITTDGSNLNNPGKGAPPDSLILDMPAPTAVCVGPTCAAATITSFAISNNVITFQGVNSFVAGETIALSGLSNAPYLSGVTLTVLSTGLTAAQFECSFTSADVASTSSAGTATPAPPQQPIFMVMGQ
jgi:YVTN family beta-propeller protein